MNTNTKTIFLTLGAVATYFAGMWLAFGRKTKGYIGASYDDVEDVKPTTIKESSTPYTLTQSRQKTHKIKTSKTICVRPEFSTGSKFLQYTMLVKNDIHKAPQVTTSQEVFKVLKDQGLLPQEEFVALNLDQRNKVIGMHLISKGTPREAVVDPADVLRPAILSGASRIIVAHNHPSGSLEPSPEDVDLTRRISEAADIIGIRLLDHLIIGDNAYTSFRDMGLFRV